MGKIPGAHAWFWGLVIAIVAIALVFRIGFLRKNVAGVA